MPTRGKNAVPVAAATRPTMEAISHPNRMPISPPIRLSSEDSVRNWIRISLRRAPSAPSTQIPADISEQSVIVVDDVLYTGRTVRAALDALSDVGRARQTELAVLVDRGHRQLPIRADYVGKNLPTSNDEVVRVRIPPVDSVRGVWVERNGAA